MFISCRIPFSFDGLGFSLRLMGSFVWALCFGAWLTENDCPRASALRVHGCPLHLRHRPTTSFLRGDISKVTEFVLNLPSLCNSLFLPGREEALLSTDADARSIRKKFFFARSISIWTSRFPFKIEYSGKDPASKRGTRYERTIFRMILKIQFKLHLTGCRLINKKTSKGVPRLPDRSNSKRIIDVLKDFKGSGGVDPCKNHGVELTPLNICWIEGER